MGPVNLILGNQHVTLTGVDSFIALSYLGKSAS